MPLNRNSRFDTPLKHCMAEGKQFLVCKFEYYQERDSLWYVVGFFLQIYLLVPLVINTLRFICFKRWIKGKTLIEWLGKYMKVNKPKQRTSNKVHDEARLLTFKSIGEKQDNMAVSLSILRQQTLLQYPSPTRKKHNKSHDHKLLMSESSISDHSSKIKHLKLNSPRRKTGKVSSILSLNRLESKLSQFSLQKVDKIKKESTPSLRRVINLHQYLPRDRKATMKNIKKKIKDDLEKSCSMHKSKKKSSSKENPIHHHDETFRIFSMKPIVEEGHKSDDTGMKTSPRDNFQNQLIIYDNQQQSRETLNNPSALSKARHIRNKSSAFVQEEVGNESHLSSSESKLEEISENTYSNRQKTASYRDVAYDSPLYKKSNFDNTNNNRDFEVENQYINNRDDEIENQQINKRDRELENYNSDKDTGSNYYRVDFIKKKNLNRPESCRNISSINQKSDFKNINETESCLLNELSYDNSTKSINKLSFTLKTLEYENDDQNEYNLLSEGPEAFDNNVSADSKIAPLIKNVTNSPRKGYNAENLKNKKHSKLDELEDGCHIIETSKDNEGKVMIPKININQINNNLSRGNDFKTFSARNSDRDGTRRNFLNERQETQNSDD